MLQVHVHTTQVCVYVCACMLPTSSWWAPNMHHNGLILCGVANGSSPGFGRVVVTRAGSGCPAVGLASQQKGYLCIYFMLPMHTPCIRRTKQNQVHNCTVWLKPYSYAVNYYCMNYTAHFFALVLPCKVQYNTHNTCACAHHHNARARTRTHTHTHARTHTHTCTHAQHIHNRSTGTGYRYWYNTI